MLNLGSREQEVVEPAHTILTLEILAVLEVYEALVFVTKEEFSTPRDCCACTAYRVLVGQCSTEQSIDCSVSRKVAGGRRRGRIY